MSEIITRKDTGYTLKEVIENEVELGRKWLEIGWFENDNFEDGHYYYFSNCYGSSGAYYNKDTDELKINDELSEDEVNELDDDWWWVELPIDKEIRGIHVDFNYTYFRDCIMDENEKCYNVDDERGVYQYIDGLFYKVELV